MVLHTIDVETSGLGPQEATPGFGAERSTKRLAAKARANAAFYADTPHDDPSRQVMRARSRAPSYRWDTRGTRTIAQ